MSASVKDWNSTISGKAFAMNITPSDTGVMLPLKLASNAAIADNPETRKIVSVDARGRETNISTDVTAYKPTLTLSYSGVNIDTTALQRGRKVGLESLASLILPKQQLIRRNSYTGAASGQIGFGVAEDDTAIAVVMDTNGEPLQLTQVAYAGFNPATNNQFAIGANFARRFSDNLIGTMVNISLELTTISGRQISEDSLPDCRIEYLLRMDNDQIVHVDIPNAIIDPSNSGFDPSADSTEVVFDISGIGVCEPYIITELPDKIYCDN